MSATVPNAKSQSYRFQTGLRSYDLKTPSNAKIRGGSVLAPASPQTTPRVTLNSRETTAQHLANAKTSPRRADWPEKVVFMTKTETNRPASPFISPRDIHYQTTQASPRLAFNNRTIRQQSVPTTTACQQQSLVPVVNLEYLTSRQTSQPPFATAGRAVTPEPNFREVNIIYDGSGLQGFQNVIAEPIPHDQASYDNTFNSEIELLAPPPVGGDACSLEELHIAIQGVMQTIEEERAVRANETSDLRRELYQAIHHERETHSREFNDLKSEVSTQHGWFMKEIIRRSVYEARLQNEVDQVCKEPQEISDRLAAIERQLEALRASVEPLHTATAKAQEYSKTELGPEVLSDPRLVELLVASTDSSLQMIQEQLHDLVRQKIEEHLGKVDDSSSLFGMVKEALSTSRLLKDEMNQVKEILGPIPSSHSLSLEPLTSQGRGQPGQALMQQLDPHGRPPNKVKRREGNYM